MTIVFNGEPTELPPGMTVADLLRELNVVPQRVAVEVNLEVVPRSRIETFQLSDGDRLEVVSLVGGG
jgi:thiamine biosynthesis protein ThiS